MTLSTNLEHRGTTFILEGIKNSRDFITSKVPKSNADYNIPKRESSTVCRT